MTDPDGLICRHLVQNVGSGGHGQPPRQIEVLEGDRIFHVLPDVFGNEIVHAAEVIGITLQFESYIRFFEMVDHRHVVYHLHRFNPFLIGEMLAQSLMVDLKLGGIDDIHSRIRRAVMPGDTGTEFERPDGIIFIRGEGLGHPVLNLAGSVVQ